MPAVVYGPMRLDAHATSLISGRPCVDTIIMGCAISPEDAALSSGRWGRRLWTAALGLSIFAVTLAIGNAFLPQDRAITGRALGHDFLAFYTAGHFARTSQLDRIYDLPAIRQFQSQVGREADLDLSQRFGPFWNPPFYAWVFAPLAALPYRTALWVWWGLSAICLAGSIWLLVRMVPATHRWRERTTLALLLIFSLPSLLALAHGQNTFFSLLILCAVVTLWRKAATSPPAALWAGVIAGLLFYKPQLGLVVALVLAAALGRRAVLGLGITGTVLLLVSVLAMPDLTCDWLTRMPNNLRWMQEDNAYYWERHVTLKALWRLLLQGHATGAAQPLVQILWGLSILGVGSYLAAAVQQVRRDPSPPPRQADLLIAATIVCMPLLMPFYFDYDLLLLAIPAVLHAADPHRRNSLTWAWIALYAILFASQPLAAAARVHVAVLVLTALAAGHIAELLRRREAREPFGSALAGV